MHGLIEWGDRYVTDGPPPTVWEHSCGEELRLRSVCVYCGEPVEFDELQPRQLGAVR